MRPELDEGRRHCFARRLLLVAGALGGTPSNERSDRPHGFQVKKMEYGRREETQTV